MYNRLIQLDKIPKDSFFLWGSRQTGKSTLLKLYYPAAIYVDLLMSDVYARYISKPALLREDLGNLMPGALVIIDEVQKIPILLDEVHWLIENRRIIFALSGSSASKLRRGHANLLGGRALRRELFGLVSRELGEDFNLLRMLNHGYLPPLYLAEPGIWKRKILSYVGDYIKEDVAAQSRLRNLTGFTDFLACASLSDTEIISFSSFARDVGVSANTVKEYFAILVDSLIGSFLPVYANRPKRRVSATPKFYFHDVGLVNCLAKRGAIEFGSELCGKAFENWVAHELRAYNEYVGKLEPLSFWRLSTGVEVDFIVGDMILAVEAKSSKSINSDHLKGLRELKLEHPHIQRRIVVNCQGEERVTEDGIRILSAQAFTQALWNGELF